MRTVERHSGSAGASTDRRGRYADAWAPAVADLVEPAACLDGERLRHLASAYRGVDNPIHVGLKDPEADARLRRWSRVIDVAAARCDAREDLRRLRGTVAAAILVAAQAGGDEYALIRLGLMDDAIDAASNAAAVLLLAGWIAPEISSEIASPWETATAAVTRRRDGPTPGAATRTARAATGPRR